MRTALVLIVIAVAIVAAMATQRARDRAHQQPLGTETMHAIGR